jgi:hypothetical protein
MESLSWLVFKDRRKFHQVGMVWVWLGQKRPGMKWPFRALRFVAVSFGSLTKQVLGFELRASPLLARRSTT